MRNKIINYDIFDDNNIQKKLHSVIDETNAEEIVSEIISILSDNLSFDEEGSTFAFIKDIYFVLPDQFGNEFKNKFKKSIESSIFKKLLLDRIVTPQLTINQWILELLEAPPKIYSPVLEKGIKQAVKTDPCSLDKVLHCFCLANDLFIDWDLVKKYANHKEYLVRWAILEFIYSYGTSEKKIFKKV